MQCLELFLIKWMISTENIIIVDMVDMASMANMEEPVSMAVTMDKIVIKIRKGMIKRDEKTSRFLLVCEEKEKYRKKENCMLTLKKFCDTFRVALLWKIRISMQCNRGK